MPPTGHVEVMDPGRNSLLSPSGCLGRSPEVDVCTPRGCNSADLDMDGRFAATWKLKDVLIDTECPSASGNCPPDIPAFLPILKRQKTLEECAKLPRVEWLLPNCAEYSHSNLLKHLCREVQAGLRCYEPILAEMSAGGAYFMRSKMGRIIAVFKPVDEEPFAANNPRTFIGSPSGSLRMKNGIPAGESAIREAAAFILDQGLARCPPTVMVKAVVPKLKGVEKMGSLQQFQPHLGSSDDFGPSRFNQEDCHRIMLLDIRILNQDRHAGNILVCDSILGLSNSSSSNNNNNSENGSQPDISSGKGGLPSAPLGLRRSYSIGPGLEVAGRSESTPRRADHQGLRLVPIDHGFALPHPLSIDESELAWLHWPQSRQPLPKHLVEYVKRLDVDQDIARLRSALGSSLPAHCYLTLRIGTALLQCGVRRGLTLHDIASFVVRDDFDVPSKLECLIASTHRAIACNAPPNVRPSSSTAAGSLLLSCERDHQAFMSLFVPQLEAMVAEESTKPSGSPRVSRSVSA